MIKLKQIMPISDLSNYKLHVAKYNGTSNPLDEYIENFDNWLDWNKYRGEGNKNRFNRKFVISFMEFYPERGVFLFGGIFEIIHTHADYYDIKLLDQFKEFIGKLKVTNIKTVRGSSFLLEKHYDSIEVTELLPESYSSHVFPGYENINYNFQSIKTIIRKDTADWKGALENIKGVYMLTDSETGKRYIGSAYSEYGIWSRWNNYCETGHGGNKKLKELVNKKGYNYVAKHFIFTLLETHPKFTSDDFIILRESYWKNVMLSKEIKYGYNAN